MAFVQGRVTNPRKSNKKSRKSGKAPKKGASKSASHSKAHTSRRRRRNPHAGTRFSLMQAVTGTAAAMAGGVASRFVTGLYDQHVTDRFGLDSSMGAVGKLVLAVGIAAAATKFGPKSGAARDFVAPAVYGMIGNIGGEVYDDLLDPVGADAFVAPAAAGVAAGMRGFNTGSLYASRNNGMAGFLPSGTSPMAGTFATAAQFPEFNQPDHAHMQGDVERRQLL